MHERIDKDGMAMKTERLGTSNIQTLDQAVKVLTILVPAQLKHSKIQHMNSFSLNNLSIIFCVIALLQVPFEKHID